MCPVNFLFYRPYQTRRRSPIYRALFGIGSQKDQSNADRGIVKRILDSLGTLDTDLAFLSGFLTLLPHLNLKRTVQFKDDGERLYKEAYTFQRDLKNPTVSAVRRLRVFSEKIRKYVEKVERDIERKKQ